MRKIQTLFLTLLFGLIFVACNKEEISVYDPQAVLEREASVLSAYITEKGLSDSAHLDQASGIWYVLEDPGKGQFQYTDSTTLVEGQALLVNAQVLVKYTGKLLNDTIFDQKLIPDTTGPHRGYIALLPDSIGQGQINAWQRIFFPKEVGGILPGGLQKGAKVRIITPSIWGYKDQSKEGVPPNSPLDFEIEVLDIRRPSAETAP